MNRYSQLSFSDFSEIPLPQLPFEQLDAVLGQFQQQKDITDTLADQGFDHLNKEPDQLYAQKVRGEIDQLRQSLVESAQAGDTSNYMADLKEAQQKLLKMRAPGGGIKALADRKAQYNEQVKAIQEKFKNAPEKYVNQLISEIQVGDVENPYGGYNPITGPNAGEYRFIGEDLMKNFNNFAADEYGWVDVGNGKYIFEGSNKVVREEDVRRAAEQFLSQPMYQDQLRREAQITDVGQRAYLQQIIGEDFQGMDTRQIQQTLKSSGFDVAVDGQMGPQTQQAMSQYAAQQLQGGREVEISDTIRSQSLINSYIDPVVEKYAYSASKKSAKGDPYGLIYARKAAEKTDTFVNGLVMPGMTVKREVPKPKDFVSSLEGTERKLESLQTKLERAVNNNAPDSEINTIEAEINMLENASFKKEKIMERAKELAADEINLDTDLYITRRDPAAIRSAVKEMYEQTAGMDGDERQLYIEQQLKENPEVFGDYTSSTSTVVKSPEMVARKLATRMNRMDNKIEKTTMNKLGEILENQTDIAPKGIVIGETPDGKRFSKELLKGLDVTSAVIYNEDGPIGEETVKVFGGRKKEEVLASDNFNVVEYIPAGLYGEGNVILGVDNKTGKTFYVQFKDSNVDEIAAQRLLESGDETHKLAAQVVSSPYTAQRYRDISSLPIGIPDKIEYNGVFFEVEKTSNGEVKVSTDDGQSFTYPSALDAVKSINNSFVTEEENQ